MRQNATFAVIGAGYGDEGKGLLTDALASMLGGDTFVVRFNGGAQAGHTVMTPDSRRHVFHHVGSGSFAGATTGLSRHFISNPRVLAEELEGLARHGVTPRLVADSRGLLTTPWDMMLNQFLEQERGSARHGSCGLGIGETVERSLQPAYVTTLADLGGNLDSLRARFDAIRTEWVPKRLTQLGMPHLWLKHRGLFLAPDLLDSAVVDAAGMATQVDIVPQLLVPSQSPIVFEGAQGLMLDQTNGAFPYVTRSNTGLLNVVETMQAFGRASMEVLYATRAYVTRHGVGPLAHEQPAPPSAKFVDETNRPNPWQGTLRFGALDLDVLGQAISADLASVADSGLQVVPRLAVTCADHLVDGEANWVAAGRIRRGSLPDLLEAIRLRLGIADDVAVSAGPTRETLRGIDGCEHANATARKAPQNLGKAA